MLNEFEKQLDKIVGNYNNNSLSYEECVESIRILLDVWSFCRLDLKNRGNKNNNIQIIDKNEGLNVSFPTWFKNNEGAGCQIISTSNEIALYFKCLGSGNLDVVLRSLNYKNGGNNRVPVYVNYVSLSINNQEMLDNDTLVWHDDPHIFNKKTNDNEIINLYLSFDSIHDYFPKLKEYLTEINSSADLKIKYDKIKRYISYEKIFIRLNDIEYEIYGCIAAL